MKRICIMGSFSGRNIGDDAILRGMMNFFNQEHVDYHLVLLTKFPAYFRGFSPALAPIRSRVGLLSINTFLELFRSDLVLIPQGSLFSYKLFNPFYNRVLPYYLVTVVNRLFAKKPIGLFLGGIGPITDKTSAFFIRRILAAFDFLLLRDRLSISLLKTLGIQKEFSAAADIALFCGRIETGLVQNVKHRVAGKPVLGINVNRYTSEFLQKKDLGGDPLLPLVSFLKEKAGQYFYLFMPTDIEDIEVTRRLIERVSLPGDSHLLIEKCTPEEYVGILAVCTYFMGTRMHSLILSAVAGTPFIGFNYNPKVRDFMDLVDFSSYCLEYADLSPEKITAVFEKMIDHKVDLRETLAERTAELKQAITLAMEEKILCYLK